MELRSRVNVQYYQRQTGSETHLSLGATPSKQWLSTAKTALIAGLIPHNDDGGLLTGISPVSY